MASLELYNEIILIDDDPAMARLLKKTIEIGFEDKWSPALITVKPSVSLQLYDSLLGCQPAIIFCDWTLSNENPFTETLDLLGDLRRLYPRTCIFVCSALDDPLARMMAYERGVNDWVQKSSVPGTLTAVIRAGARKHRLLSDPDEFGGLDQINLNAICLAIARFGGDKKAAAKSLGVSRDQLYTRLKEAGIDPASIVEGPSEADLEHFSNQA